jgi:hypothetical protein
MKRRIATGVIGSLDALVAAIIAVGTYNSTSDNATIGLDHAAGVIVAGLFVVTGLPALIISGMNRAPRTGLALALAFPAIFVLLFAAVLIVMASAG